MSSEDEYNERYLELMRRFNSKNNVEFFNEIIKYSEQAVNHLKSRDNAVDRYFLSSVIKLTSSYMMERGYKLNSEKCCMCGI